MSVKLLRALVVVLIGVLAIGFAPAALAAGPEHTHIQIEGGDNITCDATGDGVADYHLEGRFWVNAQQWVTFDKAGVAVKYQWQTTWLGQLTIVELGKVFQDRGAVADKLDLRDGTYTNPGNHEHLILLGGGAIWRDAGKIIIDLATGQVTFVAGQHPLLNSDQDICGLLGIGRFVTWESLPQTVKELQ